ncbi:MAG: hypothetical protein KDK40_05620 [Chlamydiia bacterium]|nr:hypothetical protein [Chlamydiia bacterium]
MTPNTSTSGLDASQRTPVVVAYGASPVSDDQVAKKTQLQLTTQRVFSAISHSWQECKTVCKNLSEWAEKNRYKIAIGSGILLCIGVAYHVARWRAYMENERLATLLNRDESFNDILDRRLSEEHKQRFQDWDVTLFNCKITRNKQFKPSEHPQVMLNSTHIDLILDPLEKGVALDITPKYEGNSTTIDIYNESFPLYPWLHLSCSAKVETTLQPSVDSQGAVEYRTRSESFTLADIREKNGETVEYNETKTPNPFVNGTFAHWHLPNAIPKITQQFVVDGDKIKLIRGYTVSGELWGQGTKVPLEGQNIPLVVSPFNRLISNLALMNRRAGIVFRFLPSADSYWDHPNVACFDRDRFGLPRRGEKRSDEWISLNNKELAKGGNRMLPEQLLNKVKNCSTLQNGMHRACDDKFFIYDDREKPYLTFRQQGYAIVSFNEPKERYCLLTHRILTSESLPELY